MFRRLKRKAMTVRSKVCVMMLMLVMFCIGFTAIINWVFLDKYYLYQAKKSFESYHEQLLDIAHSSESSILYRRINYDYAISKISEEEHYSIIISYGDSLDNEFTLNSGTENSQYMAFKLRTYLQGRQIPKRVIEKAYDNAYLQVTKEKTSTDSFKNVYEMWGKLDENTSFLIMTRVDDIQNATRTSTQFLVIVGLMCGLITVILALYLSDRFSHHIKKLNEVTKKVSNLNFDAKFNEDSYKEINELGNSVNLMSRKLEKFIGELKNKNTELQQSLSRRDEIDSMRKEFISNVSHELKTPIALIMGYAEGLKIGINDTSPEDREFYCDVIIDESKRMNTMVKDLLMLSELEFGTPEYNSERFDAVSFVKSLVASYAILQKQKGLEIHINTDKTIMVWADAAKFETVMRNYINNALNHVNEEKVININFKIKEKEGRLRIGVFNSGTPIPYSEKARIWDKFYKVDKARTREYGGNGVGLSIVKAILEPKKRVYGCVNRDNGVEFFIELLLK